MKRAIPISDQQFTHQTLKQDASMVIGPNKWESLDPIYMMRIREAWGRYGEQFGRYTLVDVFFGTFWSLKHHRRLIIVSCQRCPYHTFTPDLALLP